ncbi:hypothetical protein [Yoonia sp. SS1-5]|uniref:Uncharacterized protein n=1 Tax=Yoonia rhodophyticola TaxID=3137370 RepID=A0AAN0NIY5_9RHOB
MPETLAAILYACLVVPPAIVQLALALGAPWGVLTLGGRWPGVLPPAIRGIALLQMIILAVMAFVVLADAHVVDAVVPAWAIWAVVGLSILSAIGNLATPSLPERRMWGPVTVLMLIASVIVAVSG